MENLEKVAHFMRVMGQEIPEKPMIVPEYVRELRYSLIHEENCEIADAAEDRNIVEVADGLCDLLYVTLGAIKAYGFSTELFQKLFNEIHRSNMSKTCKTEEEADQTIAFYKDKGTETYKQQVGKLWTVNRAHDHKVLKSVNYSKPDLKSILEEAGIC